MRFTALVVPRRSYVVLSEGRSRLLGNRRIAIDTLAGIRAGDERALAALMQAEWAGLVQFLGRRTPSAEAAADAAQEAFVRLWEKREHWAPGSARALLFRIAANVAADGGRASRVRRAHAERASHDPPPRPPTPEDEFAATDAHRRFEAAFDALPPKRREVFELVRFHALSYRDVGAALDLSPQTVANHMSLALRDLRAALSDLITDGSGRGGDEGTAGTTGDPGPKDGPASSPEDLAQGGDRWTS